MPLHRYLFISAQTQYTVVADVLFLVYKKALCSNLFSPLVDLTTLLSAMLNFKSGYSVIPSLSTNNAILTSLAGITLLPNTIRLCIGSKASHNKKGKTLDFVNCDVINLYIYMVVHFLLFCMPSNITQLRSIENVALEE